MHYKYFMSLLPIQLKPKSVDLNPRRGHFDYSRDVIEVPDLITKEQSHRLIEYAKNKDQSGLHRRGSKNLLTSASFYTCLVFHYQDPIYEMLNYVWGEYAKKIDADIEFMEPYEIKIYEKDDRFDRHHDFCIDPVTYNCRKINLSLQLSDDQDYDGGDLLISDYVSSRKFGTGVFFPADVYHTVTPITRGSRISLIGHSWGPYNKVPGQLSPQEPPGRT